MKGDKIYYYDRGSFYTLSRPSECFINIFPDSDIVTPFITLTTAGWMSLAKFYSWDGPSGPTFNTKSTMRPSLYHDATAQLIRLRLLDPKWLGKAHDNLRDMGLEDGMYRWRVWLWHREVVQKGMNKAMTNYESELEVVAP